MTTLPITAARDQLSELGNRVAFGGERLVIERRGKFLFALVSQEDLELLEALEDKLDLDVVRKRMKEPSVSWQRVKKELGL